MKQRSKKLTQLLHEAQNQIDAKNWTQAKNLLLKTKLLEEENFAVIFQMGWCQMQLGQLDEAIHHMARVESICDKKVDVLNSVALAYIHMHQWERASRVLLRAMELDASIIETYLNLSAVFSNLCRHKESLDFSLKAIALDLSNIHAHLNMGVALVGLGFLKEAKVALETCLMLEPDSLDANLNMGVVISRLENAAESIPIFEKCILLAESSGYEKINCARFLLSYQYLSIGQIDKGWAFYEYGFDPTVPAYAARAPARKFPVPRWTGQPIPGQCLLVWAEQGLGDEILFLSCMKDVLKSCTDVILECAPRLVPVMARSFPTVTVRASAYDVLNFNQPVFHDFDHQIPLGSLPSLYRRSLHDFRHSAPFVIADDGKKERFNHRLAGYEGKLKVGICWRSGLLNAERNAGYSAISDWAQLLQLQNCVFINLQYGDCEAELAEVETHFGVSILRWKDLDLKNDIDDVFALMDCLDLVITAATAVNPMAGSIGKATFLLQDSWGWSNIGTDYYPWFPNTRCFVPESGNSPAEVMPDIAAIVSSIADASMK
jgi:tetratricopeptide (TPR) repeat protein